MLIINLVILLNTNFNVYLCTEDSHWMNVVVDRISAEMTLKRISVFTYNRLSHDKDDDLILSTITKRFPTIFINLERLSKFNNYNNNRLISKSYKHFRQFSCFAIVLRNNCNKKNIQKVMDVFEIISHNSTSPRPKVLVVSADQANWNIDEFKHILIFAWHNKYLDFSMVGKDSDGNLKILHYNPFTENHFIGNIDLNTKIFPDKMRDMHGYLVRLPVFNYLPLLKLKISSNLDVKEEVEGSYYNYFEVICEARNCSLNPVIQNISNIIDGITENLKKNNFHVFPVGYYREAQFYSKKTLMGVEYGYAKLIFIVPVRKESKFNVPIFFYSFTIFIVFTILFLLLSKMFKLPSNYWNFLNLYRALLGHKIQMIPSSVREKIILLFLVFLAIIFMAEFLSLTRLILQKTDSLDSISEIYKSKIPIYAMFPKVVKKYLMEGTENEVIKKIWETAIQVKDFSSCTDLLIKSQNVVCITFDFRAIYYVEENLDSNGKRIMKIVDGGLYGDYMAFPYEDGSPFVEKFDEVMKGVARAGLEKHMEYLERKPKIFYSEIEELQDPYIIYRILIVFTVGITLSIFSFCFEMLKFKYYDKKRSNFVNKVIVT